MTTFKQILAGCMTAGLILGSLPAMGAGNNKKPLSNAAEGSDAYRSLNKSDAEKPKLRMYESTERPCLLGGKFAIGAGIASFLLSPLIRYTNNRHLSELLAFTSVLSAIPMLAWSAGKIDWADRERQNLNAGHASSALIADQKKFATSTLAQHLLGSAGFFTSASLMAWAIFNLGPSK